MSIKIVAFGASSSKNSINKKFASYAVHQLQNASVNLMDLNDYEMPIFSIDRERTQGIPQLAHDFKAHLKASDGIVISFAEHNGAYSAAFKNIFDWISRIERDVWANKPMLLLATSPGARGGKTVLGIAVDKFKFMNSNVILHFSLPSFRANFSEEKGITNPELDQLFKEKLNMFSAVLNPQPGTGD